MHRDMNFSNLVLNHLQFKILSLGYSDLDSHWNFKGTCDYFNRLYIILDGEGMLENDYETIWLQKGYAYLLPEFTPYDLSCDHYLKKIWVGFNMQLIPGQDICNPLDKCLFKEFNYQNLGLLGERITSKKVNDLIWCHGTLFEMISELLFEKELLTEDKMKLIIKYREVYDYITINNRFDLTLTEISDSTNISIDRLTKDFKRDMGLTLKEYVQQQLLQNVVKDLLLTNETIGAIAEKYAFKDQFYFSRFFKKQLGVSPTQYRNRYKD